jgi:hypothetical protein
MAEKEESVSAVKITNVSFSLQSWGANEGGYEGSLKYQVDDDTLEMKINHDMCKVILKNSHEELLKIIHRNASELVLKVIACDNPISKSKKERESEQSSDSESD